MKNPGAENGAYNTSQKSCLRRSFKKDNHLKCFVCKCSFLSVDLGDVGCFAFPLLPRLDARLELLHDIARDICNGVGRLDG